MTPKIIKKGRQNFYCVITSVAPVLKITRDRDTIHDQEFRVERELIEENKQNRVWRNVCKLYVNRGQRTRMNN